MQNSDTLKAEPLAIGELEDSSPLLQQPEQLREKWDRDGALFFRGAINPEAVGRVRDEYLERLKEMGVVDRDESEPVWNGTDELDGAKARPIPDRVWQDLVADPRLDGTVRTFLGHNPNWVPIVVHRSAPPMAAGSKPDTFAARHQDGVFNYGIDFVTCWIPLMDIDDEVGGLAVVPGSHKSSLYPSNAFDNPDIRVGIAKDTIPDGDWRRPDYKVGDILMFHSMTAHCGLPNRSNKIRLSTDIRFLPETVAKPIVGKVTSCTAHSMEVSTEGQPPVTVNFDDTTIVRGPKGHPVDGEAREGVIFEGAELIAVPQENGAAKLVRSVSRKFVDLPGTWYETFPEGWVN